MDNSGLSRPTSAGKELNQWVMMVKTTKHLESKTLIHVFHCDSAEIRFVWQDSDHTDIFINQRIECYLNNTINLRPLTPHITPCYTHKMAIVSWPYILWRHLTLCIWQITFLAGCLKYSVARSSFNFTFKLAADRRPHIFHGSWLYKIKNWKG